MYLPFLLLRLWGWPGFWAFCVPNVLGCAAFGWVLSRQQSRLMQLHLGWAMVIFSAVTVAYQCYFAGWAAQYFFVGNSAMAMVVSTGAPIAVLVAGMWMAVRSDALWLVWGAVAFALSVGVLAWGAAADGCAWSAPLAGTREPLVEASKLWWAAPTIAAGFLLCPYLDLTFHRAVQRAPQPRLAFAVFGATFALMLLGVASLYDPATGGPTVGWQVGLLWGVQLAYTLGAHLRELMHERSGVRMPASLVAVAVIAATPAFLFSLGPSLPPGAAPLAGGATRVLLPGEPLYLAFLGFYGLLFPALVWLEGRSRPRWALGLVLAAGVPCYLLGAWDFLTYLMPVPVLLAALLGAGLPRSQPVAATH